MNIVPANFGYKKEHVYHFTRSFSTIIACQMGLLAPPDPRNSPTQHLMFYESEVKYFLDLLKFRMPPTNKYMQAK